MSLSAQQFREFLGFGDHGIVACIDLADRPALCVFKALRKLGEQPDLQGISR